MPSLSQAPDDGSHSNRSSTCGLEDDFIGSAAGDVQSSLSPLVKSLQGRLERAEEQIRRARERERGLRERLEGDDISHLLAAQRAQAESLRRENEMLKQEVKDLQSDTDGSEAQKKLRAALRESEDRCKELSDKLAASEARCGELNGMLALEDKRSQHAHQALKQAETATKLNAELERKVKNLTVQLKDASSDLGEAAEHALSQKQEVAKLKEEIEMQQSDILSLQKQLSDVVAEDSALRIEKDEEIERMQMRMVSKTDLELAKQDNEALQTKNADLLRENIELDNKLREKIWSISSLETQLAEATNMWHAAARDGQELRKKIQGLEAREPEMEEVELQLRNRIEDKNEEVGRKVDEILESNKRIAALTVELHGMSGRLSQSRSEHMDCLRRIAYLTQHTVGADIHARLKESLERSLKRETEEKLQLRKENAKLREQLGQRAASSVANLKDLCEQLVGLETTMQMIEQAGFTLKTDAVHEVGRLQHSNRDLQHSVMKMAHDLQIARQSANVVDSDMQTKMMFLKNRAEHESKTRSQDYRKLQLIEEAMGEFGLRLLEAEDTAVATEQYLRDVMRVMRVNPARHLSPSSNFRSTYSLSAKESARQKSQSPLRKLFLDLEGAADNMGHMYQIKSQHDERLEVYRQRVKELETELFELRSSSVPLQEYKEMTKELASECDNVRKFTKEHVTARFQDQMATIEQLTHQRDSAVERVNVLEAQLQRDKIGLERFSKSSGALQSRVKMLEDELNTARRTNDTLMHEKDEAARLVADLQVRNKYLQQERDQTEADLRSCERDITKLKSVIKVATDAVRKAAEQRYSDAAKNGQSSMVVGDASADLDPIRLQVLEMSKERDDLAKQLRESQKRETEVQQQLQRAFAGESGARQSLAESRKELKTLRAANESRIQGRSSLLLPDVDGNSEDGMRINESNMGGEGTDTDTDSDLPLPPSHEKAKDGATADKGEGAKPPTGRASGIDGGIGRGLIPRGSASKDDSDDEDEYVRQTSMSVSRSRAGSRMNTPAHAKRSGVTEHDDSTTAAAGSFISAGDVENRIFAR